MLLQKQQPKAKFQIVMCNQIWQIRLKFWRELVSQTNGHIPELMKSISSFFCGNSRDSWRKASVCICVLWLYCVQISCGSDTCSFVLLKILQKFLCVVHFCTYLGALTLLTIYIAPIAPLKVEYCHPTSRYQHSALEMIASQVLYVDYGKVQRL